MCILDATQGTDGIVSGLLNYGVLGIFAVIMIAIIRYLTKEYKTQNQVIINTYVEQIKLIVTDKDKAVAEKNEINDKFLVHLETTEVRLLDIITENSKAFGKVADSIEKVANSISLLVHSIEDRFESTDNLNLGIKTLIAQFKQK